MTTDIELGALLRRLREARKEPLRVVAAAADMDSTLLSRIERGERVPTERQIEALARHFDVPVEELRPMRNAARMMRQWIDPEEVLRAADVIERSSGSSRRRRAVAEEWLGDADIASHYAAAAPGMSPVPRSDVIADTTVGSRAEKLEAIEQAADAGARALDQLERASRDRDSVLALRATELMRQLRSKLG
jgi:transcriptional regulator with XRE-family HTH domain